MKTALFIAALLLPLGVVAGDRPPPSPPPPEQPPSSTTVSTSDEGKSRKKQYLWLGAAALGAYFIWSWDKPASDPQPAVQFGVRVHEH